MLFHTATLNDLSPQCLRYSLLQYCQSPAVERVEVAGLPVSELQRLAATADRDRVRQPEPFESWFELDVFLEVTARGYRALPQYEVAGYRIDLVVEGMNRRVAVECDGDSWHGPERFEDDMARQRMLERCGWRFWRVRGSAFSLDPDRALEDLWETLKREGVYPRGCEPLEDPAEPRDVVDQLAGTDASEAAPAGIEATLKVEPTSGEIDDPVATPQVAKHAKPVGPEASRGAPELVDSPYRTWISATQLPDPTSAYPSDLILSIIEIVSVEGPHERAAALSDLRQGSRSAASRKAVTWCAQQGTFEGTTRRALEGEQRNCCGGSQGENSPPG